MAHTITDNHGNEIEVLTTGDLDDFENRLAGKMLRWLVSGGFVLLFGAALSYARFENRLGNLERDDQRTATARASESAELRSVIRKVDSLTYVIGTQTEILRDIQRRVR